jgi:hypothetical protein
MSKNKEDHIADLRETFANLRAAGLKLNPEKCISGVSKGKMLGYIICAEGIKANPDKAKAIMTMAEPLTKKEVQRLTGRIAALSRFFSKSAKRPPILLSPKKRRQSIMGATTVRGFQAAQKLYGDKIDGDSARFGSPITVVRGSHRPRGQRSSSPQKRRGDE